MGCYLSQDPIGLAGGNPTLYGYVFDTNIGLDVFGLDLHHIIPNQIAREFGIDNLAGFTQNRYKNQGMKNLIILDKPFHGNHPAYNEYVRREVQALKDTGNLNVQSIEKVQNKLVKKINKAKIEYYNTGENLNDYFKKKCH